MKGLRFLGQMATGCEEKSIVKIVYTPKLRGVHTQRVHVYRVNSPTAAFLTGRLQFDKSLIVRRF